MAARRPYRECRSQKSYKEASSESEDDFLDVDSSFNQSFEAGNIEEEKKFIEGFSASEVPAGNH